MDAPLSHAEVQRYARHLMIPEVGMEGQRKLKSASTLVVGTGGLGSPAALYLAAAGVGRLGLVDYDVVDSSNLQRQVIHSTSRMGELKVESARQRLRDLNPYIQVDAYNTVFSSINAREIAAEYDLIIDGTDNFPTRYLINDLCVLTGKPYVYGSIFRFEGQVSVFDARLGPCYRCLFPEPPAPDSVPSCSTAGVFGVLPGTIGTLQATEAVKLILGVGQTLVGSLLLYDALETTFQTVRLRKNPNCKVCGSQPSITQLVDYEEFCGVPAAGSHVIALPAEQTITVDELAARMGAADAPLVLDVREDMEREISRIPGALAIPLGELPERMQELDPAQEIVVYCRTGVRSSRAVDRLLRAGFPRARSLTGGINAWAREIDPSMYQY
ncbi:MAG TPA: molybdopterin-synthase adenylyltransferase MoeB [Anaerolineaceae bacterium]